MPTVSVDQAQSSSAIAGQTIRYIGSIAAQQLPGCPDTLIYSQLSLVLRHFYTESTGWRAPVGPFSISQGKPNIYLNPIDQDTQLMYVLQAYLYPFPTAASNTKQYLPPSTTQILSNVTGPPGSHFMLESDLLQVQPTPDATYGAVLYVIAALCPTLGAQNLPNIAYTHHLDGLLAGLYARLYSMPKKPWTDAKAAAEYKRTYLQEITKARDFAVRGQGSSDVPFVFPSFANANPRTGFGSSR